MNVMTVDGFHATIEFDPDLDLFREEIFDLNGGADFYGKNPKDLRAEFKRSLQVFLEVCQHLGTGGIAGLRCVMRTPVNGSFHRPACGVR